LYDPHVSLYDNQAEVMRHRVREQLSSQRSALLNAFRGHPSEMGDLSRASADTRWAASRRLCRVPRTPVN
jgi:hypothetical protein